ncbi:FTHL17 family protein [Megaselia abdita]
MKFLPTGSNVPVDMTTKWIDIKHSCVDAMRKQIQKEIHASYQYLAMAAYFSRDTVNRPGFAEHFFGSAKEEREHALHLIEYLSMRGNLTSGVTNLITSPTVKKSEWSSAVDALTDALNLEAEVTESIRGLIITCETDPDSKYNDYHLVDYLTGVYLEEQYKGQRELAGKLSTLKKMMASHGEIGEFLYDKDL